MAKLSCGIDTNEVMDLIDRMVAKNGASKVLSIADFERELGEYEYEDLTKSPPELRKFTNIEKAELSKALYDEYGKEVISFIKNDKESDKGSSAFKQVELINYVKHRGNAEKINLYRKEMARKLDEAYEFVGAERERRLAEIYGDIAEIEGDNTIDLLKENMWALPLSSMGFWIGNVVSNAQQYLLRNIRSANTPKDIKELINEYTKAYAGDVIRGGIPIQSILSAEKNSDNVTYSSLERDYGKKSAKTYFKYFGKIINRVNNYLDSGLAKSMEIVYYQMLQNEVTNAYVIDKKIGSVKNLTEGDKKAIKEIAYKKMFGETTLEEAKKAATKLTDDAYEKVGIKVDDKLRSSSQYKRQVYDRMRSNNFNSNIQSASRLVALEDYFKKDMKKPQDMLDYVSGGIMMLPVISTTYVTDMFAKVFKSGNSKRSLFADSFILNYIGYINGAMNFVESGLEYMPLYGIPKTLLLKATKTDEYQRELYKNEKINTLVAKQIISTIASSVIFATLKALEEVVCDDENKNIVQSIVANDTNTTLYVCGHKVPAYIFGVWAPNIYLTNLAYQSFIEKKDINSLARWSFVLGVLSSNKFFTDSQRDFGDRLYELRTGTELKKSKEGNQIVELIVSEVTQNAIAPFSNSPSFVSDALSFLSPNKKQKPIFEFTNGYVYSPKRIAEYSFWAMSQKLNIDEVVHWARDSRPVYDYRGREVLNYKYQTSPFSLFGGTKIKYDKVDDLVNTLEIDGRMIFNSPYRVLNSKDKDVSKRRNMTDKEYSNVQRAGGEIFNEWVVKNYDKITSSSDAKEQITEALKSVESLTLDAVEELKTDNYESYKEFIKKDFLKKKN